MNLRKKKELASKVLKVGKERIVFAKARLDEVKEAITKQDIRDLKKEGAILVKEIKGKKRNLKKRKKKGDGNVRKRVYTRKKDYMIMTRKLRGYLAELKKRGEISAEDSKDIRKKIRNKKFKSKSNLKEYLEGLK